MKMKSVLSLIFAASISVVSAPSLFAGATEQQVHGTGLSTDIVDYADRHVPHSELSRAYSGTSVLSQVDLSTDGYFPPIGDQGSINSCASWAITYYQFTHDAHKLNNISSTSSNAYSPRWTYNFVNGGSNSYTTDWEVYDVLTRQGAVTVNEYPYNVSSSVFYKWLNNETAMLNALSTKVVDYDTVEINVDSSSAVITSATDSDLNAVKQLLCAGKVLTVPTRITNGATNYSIKYATNGQKAVYRATYSGSGHLMTVVGYDDSIKCDVNGDGTIQASEKGAFKVANSWGTTFGNNGYIWVMYDALNKVSANTTNNWEASETGTRHPIFDSIGYYKDQFNYMEVENQTVNLAGVLSFTAPNCNRLGFATRRGSSASYTVLNNNANYATRSFNGSFVLDFGSLDDSISNYLSGVNWYATVDNNSGQTMSNITYKIVDDKHNVIKNGGTVANSLANTGHGNYPIYLNMQLGDVNYSGSITSEDQTLVLQYVTEAIDLSSMQLILADYDQNGVVNIIDVIAIGQASVREGNGLSPDLDINLISELYRQYAEENGLSQDFDIYELLGLETSSTMETVDQS